MKGIKGYFWDSNVLRIFSDTPDHSALRKHIERVSWDKIFLPAVVVAESWRGRLRRIDTVPKARPEEAVFPYQKLTETHKVLSGFTVATFDKASASRLIRLREDAKRRKKRIKKQHADMMIAAMALSYEFILVTRNEKDFADLLPDHQVENWIDDRT